MGYPKSQGRKVADPNIKSVMINSIIEKSYQEHMWSNTHFHLPTCIKHAWHGQTEP